MVRLLLAAKADPNLPSVSLSGEVSGLTPFGRAIIDNVDVAVLGALLDAKADVLLAAAKGDKLGLSALHLVALGDRTVAERAQPHRTGCVAAAVWRAASAACNAPGSVSHICWTWQQLRLAGRVESLDPVLASHAARSELRVDLLCALCFQRCCSLMLCLLLPAGGCGSGSF